MLCYMLCCYYAIRSHQVPSLLSNKLGGRAHPQRLTSLLPHRTQSRHVARNRGRRTDLPDDIHPEEKQTKQTKQADSMCCRYQTDSWFRTLRTDNTRKKKKKKRKRKQQQRQRQTLNSRTRTTKTTGQRQRQSCAVGNRAIVQADVQILKRHCKKKRRKKKRRLL
ncbi:hypothetical protein VTN02DRAFT_2731 [Thermoascus thermophilus]